MKLGCLSSKIKTNGWFGGILSHLEVSECPGSLGMHHSLRDPLPVKVGELLDENMILQHSSLSLVIIILSFTWSSSGPLGPTLTLLSLSPMGAPWPVVRRSTPWHRHTS